MPRPRPTNVIGSDTEIPLFYTIWTPRAPSPVPAERRQFHYGGTIDINYYDYNRLNDLRILHSTIVESKAHTEPGDSGSPVVTTDGATLLGMHIAGGGGRAFMIPAYDLLDPKKYHRMDSRASMEFSAAY
jgi:hypothetical protein